VTIAVIVAAIVLVAVIASVVVLRVRSSKELGQGSTKAPLSPPPVEANLEHGEPELDGATPSVEVRAPEEIDALPSYRDRMGRSRGLFEKLRAKVSRASFDQEDLDDVEEALIRADVGVATTTRILEAVTAAKRAGSDLDLLELVRNELTSILTLRADGSTIDRSLDDAATDDRIPVWLFVGVNGVGKTTTIGKVATARAARGDKIVLAAGDTFRAAAGEQLETWGERSGAEVVRGADGADPSAVIYDAIQRAKARGARLVLADTAGRLHNKVNLVEELKKIRRVADREPGDVRETLLVLDATTGQNGVVQAREFLEATGVTGVVLTKLDGSAKGGVIVAIEAELGIPVKLVGLGEGAADLVAFDPEAFVDALLNR
jgi:fused signal recognition particle receptor